jgi:hypothetical protein
MRWSTAASPGASTIPGTWLRSPGCRGPPDAAEEVPAMLSRLLEAHELVITEVRAAAHRADELGDDGSNYLLVSEVLRTN